MPMSRSLQGIRTSVAPPFSPGRELTRLDFSSRTRSTRRKSPSVIPWKQSGFESQEPTSPEVSCFGQIILKEKWVKASKEGGLEKAAKENKLSKLKRLMFGKHRHKKNSKAEEMENFGKNDGETYRITGQSSLGRIERYASGSYDAKFGNMFVEDELIAANSGPLTLDGLPKLKTKAEGSLEENNNNIRKQRSLPPLKALHCNRVEVESFDWREISST